MKKRLYTYNFLNIKYYYLLLIIIIIYTIILIIKLITTHNQNFIHFTSDY